MSQVWIYLNNNRDRNLGKTNSLSERDLDEFVSLSKTLADSENSWSINVKDINNVTYDLTPKNPNRKEEVDNRTPQEILAEIEDLDQKVANALAMIKEML